MIDANADLKTCSKCNESKPLDAFPRRYAGGPRSNPCKACKLIQTNDWRRRNQDKVNAMARDRSKSPEYLANARERMKRWRRNNPEKKKAESLRWTERRRELRAQATIEKETNND